MFATQHRYAWPDIGSQRLLVLVVVQNWHSPFQGQSNNIYDWLKSIHILWPANYTLGLYLAAFLTSAKYSVLEWEQAS